MGRIVKTSSSCQDHQDEGKRFIGPQKLSLSLFLPLRFDELHILFVTLLFHRSKINKKQDLWQHAAGKLVTHPLILSVKTETVKPE